MAEPISSFKDTKTHYPILDGLRGVAALMVVAFHILETFSGGNHTKMLINHGYLAVDFFFLLSGFVIGYAYDDRWNRMTLGDFFKRRLIRLHPMIIIGMTIGAILFYFQASAIFPKIADTSFSTLLLITVIGFTLLPVPVSMDIRGWFEMHPLNGPAWSLFFEYVANLLYALFIRKFSNTVLAILAFIAGAALIHLAVTSPYGDIIGGWALDGMQLRIGFTRLLYPFLAGLLLSRVIQPAQFSNAFMWCTLLLIAVLAMPRVGSSDALWMNGLYDSLTIIFLFPLIVYVGASGQVEGNFLKINTFLGKISYPVYIIHYPIVYVFMAWVANNNLTLSGSSLGTIIAVSIAILIGTILLAYACVKWYDEPVRNWLTRKWLADNKITS